MEGNKCKKGKDNEYKGRRTKDMNKFKGLKDNLFRKIDKRMKKKEGVK